VKIISKIFKLTKIIYFIDGIKNYAVFKGRANRPKYWFFMLYWAIGYFLLIAIENSMGLNNIDFSNYSFSKYIPLFQYSFNQNHKHKFIKLGSISNHEDKLKNYDFVLYAGSLGKFFRNDINLFPKTSYLDVEQEFINETKNKVAELKNRFNIGISWKSFKNRYAREKSLELEELINIFKTPNCNFLNIQYGDVNGEINSFISKYKIEITTIKNLDLYKNLLGVAGLLKSLDLFISVSNSTAHLAGALGIKTLLIKPHNHATYHYWNQPTSKTPWYSSIKLINKKTLNQKNNIIKNLDKLE